mgnify:CR=1 FL=1
MSRNKIPLVLGLLLLAGCFEDRARPTPVEIEEPVRLTVQVVAPRSGISVGTGRDVTVSVTGRDLDGRGLTGVGFVARRPQGAITVDSAAIQFTSRADSTHTFVFRVPNNLPTSTQIDVYGIAWGGSATRLSPGSFLVVVNCSLSPCPPTAGAGVEIARP